MTEEDALASADPAVRAAWKLLETHEEATRDGYRMASYPTEQINQLASDMHAARGIANAVCNDHTRARDLWTARALLVPLRKPDNPIWRIEILETNWRMSYCGGWVQNTEITGPPSDDETAIGERAADLTAAGHVVQMVREQPVRTVTWQSKLPWSGTRVEQLAEAMENGAWQLDPAVVIDHVPGQLTDPPTRLKPLAVTIPAAIEKFTDGMRIYHTRRRQWGIVDGDQQNHGTTWVRFDGDQDPIEVSNECLQLTQPVP